MGKRGTPPCVRAGLTRHWGLDALRLGARRRRCASGSPRRRKNVTLVIDSSDLRSRGLLATSTYRKQDAHLDFAALCEEAHIYVQLLDFPRTRIFLAYPALQQW